MKTAARFVATFLSIALAATAPGLAPYEALAQVRAVPAAPVEAPAGLVAPTDLPAGSLGTEAPESLGTAPLDSIERQPLGSFESVGAGSMSTSEAVDRSEGRSPLFAAPVSRTLSQASSRLGKASAAADRTQAARSAAWTPAKGSESSQGWTEGTVRFDGSRSLSAASIDDLGEGASADAPLTRSFSSTAGRQDIRPEAPVRMLGAAPSPTDRGAVAHAIVQTVLSAGRMALAAGAVVGLHVGASLALPSLFGFAAAPSLWAVSSGVVLVPMALFARWRLSKVSEFPQSRGPRWLMDGAIGGILGAAAAAFPQYVPLLNGLLPAARHGVVSLGPVLGLGLMAATWTVSFYLPYITASIRGRDLGPARAKAERRVEEAPKKIPNWHYKLKTGLAIAALAGFFAFLGAAVGGLKGAAISLGISAALQFVMFFLSDKLIQAAVGGKQAPEAQYPALYRIVRELSQKAGAPMPKVFVMPRGMGPNAMATGRDPQHAVVAVTPEAMELFTERELRAVLGHEMSHVMNRDMLTSAVLGSFATAIAFMTYSLLWTVSTAKMKLRDLLARRAPKDRAVQETQNGGKGQQPEMFDPLTGGVVLTSIVGIYRALAGVWAPVIATMLQLAGGRTREFAADYDGALLTGDPAGLASAFEKLQSWKPGPGFRFDMNRAPLMMATAHLFTVSPLETLGLEKQLALRLPAVGFNTFALVGLGVVFGLLSGYSATTRMVNIGFFAWQFFGSKKYFNYAWLGALGYSAFTGWTSPLTLLVWAFFAERAAVWTVSALKRMLPRDGTPREDMDEFVFRKFVTHPATGQRIERMRKMDAAMHGGGGPTPPGASTLGAKPDGDGPKGPSLHSAPEASSRSGLDGRLLPAVRELKGRLGASANLAPLGRALNELLATGGSVRYGDPRSDGQPMLSAFEPRTRTIELSRSLRHVDPKLQAALLAASLQEASDHLEGRAPGTYEQAVRRMKVVDAFMEGDDPKAEAASLDINNSAEAGLFESLMTSRILSWQGRTAVEKRFGHLPTAERAAEDARNALRLAEAELAQRRDHLALMEEGFAMDLPEDHEKKHRAALEEIAILEASLAVGRSRLAAMEAELRGDGASRWKTKDDVIDLDALPVVPAAEGPFAAAGLLAPLGLVRKTVSSSALRGTLGYVIEALDQLEARHGRILFGPTPEGQAAYFSPVTRELVVSEAYRRIPPPLLGALLVHELTHVYDCFQGRSLTRETEHRAFTAMAVYLGAWAPGKVAKQLEPGNPAAVHAFQWMYSIRRQYLAGKTSLEAMVANSYTELFHARFSGHQSAAGTLSEFRTRTLAPAVEKLEALRDHERLLLTAMESSSGPERRGQLEATRRQLSIVEGLVTLYQRMERQYAEEAASAP